MDGIVNFNTGKAELKMNHVIETISQCALPDFFALSGEMETMLDFSNAAFGLMLTRLFLHDGGAFKYSELQKAVELEKIVRARTSKSAVQDVRMG